MLRVLLAATLVLAVLPRGHAFADEPGRTVARVHDEGRYPNDLLVMPPEEDGTGSGAGRHGRRRPIPIFGDRDAPELAPEPPTPWNLPGFGFGFLRGLSFLGYVALALCLVGLVALLVFLLARVRRLPPEEKTDTRAKARAETDVDLDPLLAMPTLSHEELAAQGRFREAVHALLIEALLSTGWAPEGRGRGLTAREIVGGYERPSPPRAPLEELLATVERIWFGGRDASRETYESALVLHGRFVRPTRPSRASGSPA